MFKGNIIKKCISLVMVIAVLMGIAAPASAATAELLDDSKIGYVALGDAITGGYGLEQEETRYHQIVAEYLGYEDTYVRKFGNRWRAEELRYLLDNDYKGDGYTKKNFRYLSSQRADIQNAVKDAEVVTVQIGVNNFATYFVEQLMNYLDPAKTPYEYDFDQVAKELFDFQDEFSADEITNAVATVREAVMEQLLAAAPDEGDIALEFIEYAIEVATYSLLSYVTSFNGMVNAIYELNPNVDLYVIGIYNPAAGEVLTYRTEDHVVAGELIKGREIEIPIGDAIGAVIELANSYAQILAPRAFNYTYVDPGTPIKLIDKMADKALPLDERIPVAIKAALLEAYEETAVTLIQELFAEYGVSKTYKDALAIAQEIVNCKTDELRNKYIRESIYELVVDEVLKRFEKELENYAGTYGNIDVTENDIRALLTDLENAADIAAREGVAEEFVVDLMTKAMVGQTFAGMHIETQDDAYEAIKLLEKNSSGDPAALRETAANMIYEKVEGNALQSFISKQDVVDLLEQLDTTTTNAERESIIDAWMNDLAVEKITEKIQDVNPAYTEGDARDLLAAMSEKKDDDDALIAKNHMLTTGGFHAYMVEKFGETYGKNTLTLQTYPDFNAFVTAVENAASDEAAKDIVRKEICLAAAQKVIDDPKREEALPELEKNDVIGLFLGMDDVADKSAYAYSWLCDFLNEPNPSDLQNKLVLFPMRALFLSAYNAYNNAATDASDAFVTYRNGVDEASEAFAQYNSLKEQAAAEILNAYETKYKGAGETALGYYADYLKLKKAAVSKVMEGFEQYTAAVDKGMASCDALTKKFDKVFAKLAKIAEVDEICLNDILDVAKKVVHDGGSYIDSMIGNLMQGDSLMNSEMTVAYMALCYYFADGIMHLPSEEGHKIMANQVIKAIKGEPTNSTTGWLANLVIDKMIDIYHMPASASGQKNPLINPDSYVAFGDNITLGSGTAVGADETYVKLLADALAMEYEDTGDFDSDVILNLSLAGMRTEELLAIVDGTYNGDAYTDARFDIEELRNLYLAQIKDLDLVTINVGINNLVTYPLTQALLAYNGKTPYEMDWERYLGKELNSKVTSGKNAVMDLLNHIVHNDSTCETTLNTVATAVEAIAYSLVGYIVNLDCAVEKIHNSNPDAVIVLTEFYNPLLDTYFTTPGTITLKNLLTGGEKTVELKQYQIDVSDIADGLINLANRFLTGYVGGYKNGVVARVEDSNIVTVPLNETPLDIDPSVSKDLSDLVEVITVNVAGRDITIKVPEYLKEAVATGGVALHPNAEGHKYIYEQILKALEFEIHADVVPENNSKYYGDADPELVINWDDASSLYDGATIVSVDRVQGENVGEYKIFVTVEKNGGYYEIDVTDGVFKILPRPIAVNVTVLDGKITDVKLADGSTLASWDEHKDIVELLGLAVNADLTEVTANCTNYAVSVNATFDTTEVIQIGNVIMGNQALELADEVHYKFEFTLNNFKMDQIVEIGLLRFYTKSGDPYATRDTDLTNTIYDQADEVYDWTLDTVEIDGTTYVARTDGIPAKNLGDDTWFRAYVKLKDGTYCYSLRYVYDAVRYAKKAVSAYPTDIGLHAVCAAMLNYGTSAQKYFGYNTNDLMNAVLDKDLISIKNLVADFNDGMIDDRLAARTSPYGEFDNKSGRIGTGQFNLTLLGAISLNAYGWTYSTEGVTEAGFFVWDHETFAKGETLTQANATYKIDSGAIDGTIEGSITGIAAAEMCDTFAVAPYIVIDDTYYYCGISRISVDYYAQKVINDTTGTYSELHKDVAKFMVVYGEYAVAYFGKK